MNLDEYEQTSGLAVKDSQRAFVTAKIKKAQSMIESALGFTLDANKAAQNLYTEAGKAPSDSWICGGSDADLLPADTEPDAVYRLYDCAEMGTEPWAHRGSVIQIDPCRAVTKVKLVHGNVTIHTYETDEAALLKSGEYGRLLDVTTVFPYHNYYRSCSHRLQVAVWADWLGLEVEDGLPDDLLSVWADQVTDLSDQTRNIKSENRGTRSYTKFEAKSPADDPLTKSILGRYAGPRGTAGRLPV